VDFLQKTGLTLDLAQANYFSATRRFHRRTQTCFGLAILEKQKSSWPTEPESP
jgi:hypothetical protein